jgi:hypothetical protein
MMIYNCGILRTPGKDYAMSDSSSQGSLLRESIVQALDHCVQATQAFQAYFSTIPTIEYANISMLQMTYLVHSTIVALTVSLDMPALPEWNAQKARDTIQLGAQLDTLSRRMQQLSSDLNRNLPKKRPDQFALFVLSLDSLKEMYEKAVRKSRERSQTYSRNQMMAEEFFLPDSCPMLSTTSSQIASWDDDVYSLGTPPGYGSANGMNGDQRKAAMPAYHDIWATMTMSWAT